MSAAHTPGPWFVGAQNDALYVIAGKEPATSNDYPWHDAPRVCLAKVYGPCAGDALPIDERGNAHLIAAAPDLLAALSEFAQLGLPAKPEGDAGFYSIPFARIERARAAIAKATGDAA